MTLDPIKKEIGIEERTAVVSGTDRNLFFENQIVPEYVTTKSAAHYLGISENALRIKVCRGEIRAHKFGRQLRFHLTEITNLFTKK